MNSTSTRLSDAVPATVTVTPVEGPDIVAPFAGEVIATVGAVVSDGGWRLSAEPGIFMNLPTDGHTGTI